MAKEKLPRLTSTAVREACKRFMRGEETRFGPPTKYWLVIDGDRYPPKAIAGIAAEIMTDEEWPPSRFASGIASGQACYKLIELGFKITDLDGKEIGSMKPRIADSAPN